MAKKRSYRRPPYSLSTLLVGGFCGFAVLGSLVLVIYFHYLTNEEEEFRFASLARNNAMFLDQARLPQSDLMAERLGKVMGARVAFLEKASSLPHVRYGGIHRESMWHSCCETGMRFGSRVICVRWGQCIFGRDGISGC